MAPLNLRRDIAMMGLLHKVTIPTAHPHLLALFPPSATPSHPHATRLSTRRHNKQLHEHCDGQHTEQMSRSLFALVNLYNLLPQHVIDAPTITSFQSMLTNAARTQCKNNANNWDQTFSPRRPHHVDLHKLTYSKRQASTTATTTPSQSKSQQTRQRRTPRTFTSRWDVDENYDI